MTSHLRLNIRNLLRPFNLREMWTEWAMSIEDDDIVRAGYVMDFMLEAFPDSKDWPDVPIDSIVIPDRFVAGCEGWAGNEYCKLRAISSTGGLTLGTRRPLSCDSDEEWYYHIWSDLSSDVGAALRGACNERCFPGGHEDIPVLTSFDAWADGITEMLCRTYNLGD